MSNYGENVLFIYKRSLRDWGKMSLYWKTTMFDNGLGSVGSALHFVLLARRFLVSNIPNGAEWVRGLVAAN